MLSSRTIEMYVDIECARHHPPTTEAVQWSNIGLHRIILGSLGVVLVAHLHILDLPHPGQVKNIYTCMKYSCPVSASTIDSREDSCRLLAYIGPLTQDPDALRLFHLFTWDSETNVFNYLSRVGNL